MKKYLSFDVRDGAGDQAMVLIRHCRWFEYDPLPDGDGGTFTIKMEPGNERFISTKAVAIRQEIRD